jgi:hypothetical protein
MELDVLYSQLAPPPVVAIFPALAYHIANKEIPYRADIIVGIHARLLKELMTSFTVGTGSPHFAARPFEVNRTGSTGPKRKRYV